MTGPVVLDTIPVRDAAGELDGFEGTCSCGHRTAVHCCTTCAAHTLVKHAQTVHPSRGRRWTP